MAAAPPAAASATLGVVSARLASANINLTATVQEFHGGLGRARLLFDYLTQGTANHATINYPGIMRSIDETHRIGLRVMRGKPPTIDLHGFGRTIKLKFK